MQMKVQSTSHKRRRSLLTEECSLAIGNTTNLKHKSSIWKHKVAGDEYPGRDESMDITTVNEQGVQWDFPNVEMRNQAYKKIIVERTIFACRSASVCQLEIENEHELESHDTERER